MTPYDYARDAKAVCALDLRVFDEELDDLSLREGQGWVIWKSKTLVAYLLYSPATAKHPAHIRSLCVAPEAQSSGYGSALMQQALSTLPKPVTLNIDRNWNAQPLRRYYAKFGFKDAGERAPNGNEVWIAEGTYAVTARQIIDEAFERPLPRIQPLPRDQWRYPERGAAFNAGWVDGHFGKPPASKTDPNYVAGYHKGVQDAEY